VLQQPEMTSDDNEVQETERANAGADFQYPNLPTRRSRRIRRSWVGIRRRRERQITGRRDGI